jgi:hypothetical protein
MVSGGPLKTPLAGHWVTNPAVEQGTHHLGISKIAHDHLDLMPREIVPQTGALGKRGNGIQHARVQFIYRRSAGNNYRPRLHDVPGRKNTWRSANPGTRHRPISIFRFIFHSLLRSLPYISFTYVRQAGNSDAPMVKSPEMSALSGCLGCPIDRERFSRSIELRTVPFGFNSQRPRKWACGGICKHQALVQEVPDTSP